MLQFAVELWKRKRWDPTHWFSGSSNIIEGYWQKTTFQYEKEKSCCPRNPRTGFSFSIGNRRVKFGKFIKTASHLRQCSSEKHTFATSCSYYRHQNASHSKSTVLHTALSKLCFFGDFIKPSACRPPKALNIALQQCCAELVV